MNEVLFARQPILDGDLTAVGYELLYREARSDHANVRDDELATARVSLRAMTEIDLERLVDHRRAWINVTREFVLGGLAQTIPPDRVVLELLEDHADFEIAVAAGCHLFQGYFFCRPELIEGTLVAPNKLALLKLAADVQDPAVDLAALVRARFCQLAGQDEDGLSSELFALGLFSVIDALTDRPMASVVSSLPFAPEHYLEALAWTNETARHLLDGDAPA